MIIRRSRPFLLMLLTAFFLATLTACGGGGGSSDAGGDFGDGGDTDTDPNTGNTATEFRFGHFNSLGAFIEGLIGVADSTVAGGSSTSLNVVIVDSAGTPVLDQQTVQFGSICAGQGLAEISPLSQATTSGGAVVQYTALGCDPRDSLFASTQIDGVTLNATGSVNTTPCTGACTGGQVGLPGGSVRVLASSPQLPSAADTEAEAITITALVRDSSNVARAGVPVNLSASSGVLILAPGSVETDASGSVEAKLHTGGDPTVRNITIFANVTGAGSDSANVSVVGTALSVDGPTSASNGVEAVYTVTLVNSAGEPLSGQTVTITQDLGTAPNSVVTNAAGQVSIPITVNGSGAATRTITATSPLTPVPSSLTVSIAQATISFGPTPAANAELPVSTANVFTAQLVAAGGAPIQNCDILFTTTRGTLSATTVTTNASGDAQVTLNTGTVAGLATVQASTTSSDVDGDCPTQTAISVSRTVEIVAVTATAVDVQANPSTLEVSSTSIITATVRDANNNPVKNQLVNFAIENYPSGSLDSASAISGSDGRAKVTFNSGNAVSSTNGVVLRATVGTTTIDDTVALTVGGQAVRVSLGFGKELIVPEGTTTAYQLPVLVSVTDSGGNPAAGATVSVKLRSTAYQTGHYVDGGAGFWVPQYNGGLVQSPDDSREPTFGCLNEDRNENGILDGRTGGGGNVDGNGTNDGADTGADGDLQIPSNTVVGEDINDNGVLEPQNAATVPSVVTMAADGTNEFFVTYPKTEGIWLQVRIDATTQVGGTEGKATAFVTLNVLADDVVIDAAPPGILRAICDQDGDAPGTAGYRTEGTECDSGGAGSFPAFAVHGSPYGEIGNCQYAN